MHNESLSFGASTPFSDIFNEVTFSSRPAAEKSGPLFESLDNAYPDLHQPKNWPEGKYCWTLTEEENSSLWEIFPNPSNGIFHLSKLVESIKVFDLTGKLVFSNDKSDSIDLTNKKNGIYFVQIKDSQIIEKLKLIKN